MNRRQWLRSSGTTLLGLGLAGCGSARAPRPAAAPRRSPARLVPPRWSWDRIIRTTVGLPPHRDVWSLEVNVEIRQRNVDAAMQFVGAMRSQA